jgi:plastocyanin
MSRFASLVVVALFACTDKAPVDTVEPDTSEDTGADTDTDDGTDMDTRPVGTCIATAITLPHRLTGNSWFADFANTGDFSAGEGCTAAAGTEVAFEVELVAGTTLTVVETGGADVVIHVKESCTTTDACFASADDNTRDRLDWAVTETGTYTVSDGEDNDLDGLADCEDSECTGTDDCPFECPAVEVALPFLLSGDDFTADFTNDVRYADGEGCLFAEGVEAVFEVELSAGETVQIVELGGLDATLHILEDCVFEAACTQSVDFGDRITFTAPDTGTYTVVVEGRSSSPSTFSRSYNIAIDTLTDEICDDLIDNDRDGSPDCDDLDCFNTEACPFECPAEPVELPGGLFSVLGQNFAADASAFEPYSAGDNCVTANGGVLAWEVELLAGESLRLSEVDRMNANWHVLRSCVPGDECIFSASNDSAVSFQAFESGTYTVVLQASSTTDINPYEVFLRKVPAEDCAAAGDEDLDGFADCADSDCLDTAECPFVCEATVVTGRAVAVGNDFNADFANPWNYGAGPACDVADGGEAVYQIDLLAGQSVRVTEAGLVDVTIHISDTCLPERPCVFSQSTPETVEFTADADGTYTVVVEARTATTVAPYDLTVEFLQPELCGDGVDNDLDGTPDCDDPDCFGDATECTAETTCFDGDDNDADGGVDCEDSDCAGRLGCGGGSVVFREDFSVWPPAGWTIVDGGTQGETWVSCEAPGCSDILTQWTSFLGATGLFAYINSDDSGFGTLSDDSLVSPVIDLSGFRSALLTFEQLFDAGGGDTASVDISTDGITWIPIASWTLDTTNGESAAVSLNGVAGSPSAQLRFRYQSQRDWFWAIDAVEVTGLW